MNREALIDYLRSQDVFLKYEALEEYTYQTLMLLKINIDKRNARRQAAELNLTRNPDGIKL